VSPVVCLSTKRKICNIVRMGVSNEVILELYVIFVVVSFIFILINFGFNIEELVSFFTSTLPSMALRSVLAIPP
jgi:hypothetical protein